MSLNRGLSLSLMAAAVAAIAFFGMNAFRAPTGGDPGQLLGQSTFVRGQVALSEVPELAKDGVKTIIALRPDGEGYGQPPAAEMEKAVTTAGMKFAYYPTANGNIPDDVADNVAKMLQQTDGPAVIYCASGNRASRAWALAEATRKDGPSADEIVATARKAGRNVSDLLPRISARVAARSQPEAVSSE